MALLPAPAESVKGRILFPLRSPGGVATLKPMAMPCIIEGCGGWRNFGGGWRNFGREQAILLGARPTQQCARLFHERTLTLGIDLSGAVSTTPRCPAPNPGQLGFLTGRNNRAVASRQ